MGRSRQEAGRQRQRRGPRASQACDNCATAKARCDNNECCQRCRRRDLPCIRPTPLYEKPIMRIVSSRKTSPASQRCTGESRNFDGPRDLFPEILHDCMQRDLPSSLSVESSGHTLGNSPEKVQATRLENPSQGQPQLGTSPEKHGDAAFTSTNIPVSTFMRDLFPQSQDTPQSDLESVFASLFSLSNVTVAFGKTIGPWHPDWQNHRAAEEKNICLEPTSHLFDEYLASPPYLASIFTVSSDTRDRILAMILNNCAKDNITKVASSFPSAEAMSRLLLRYLESHALEEDSWIHLFTFDANKAPSELLMACVASSAMKSTNSAIRGFGKALHSILHPYLFQVFEKNIIRTRHLQNIQALALFVQIGLWSGDRRMMEISEAVVGCVVQMLRYGGWYRGATFHGINLSPDDHGEVLEAKWRNWVEEESFKRIVFHMQVHCSKGSLTTGTRMPVSCFELLLPLPYHRRLWTAKTYLEWKQVYLTLVSHGPLQKISARQVLANPLIIVSLPDVYDSDCAQLILLHCISSMTRDYQQYLTVCESEDNDMTRIHILFNEGEEQRLQRLLQSTRMINESHKSQDAVHRSLLIELLSMHVFAPFGHFELAAGREGQDEAKAAYRSAQIWSKSCKARQAVSHAGQAVRYLREIPVSQFTDFHAIITYQVSLCLWIYGAIAANDATSSARGIPSIMSQQFALDTDETAKSQQWIILNGGIPAICQGVSRNGAEEGNQILLSSTQEVMVCLQELLPREALTGQSHVLISSVYDLMSALSTVRPGIFLS